MNGPDNYREADLILSGDADPCSYGCPHSGCQHEIAMLLRAIGHGLLALTAAVVDSTAIMRPEERAAWDHATGRIEDQQACRAHPNDCPNGPEPHPYYNPPEFEGRPPCCVQPWERSR